MSNKKRAKKNFMSDQIKDLRTKIKASDLSYRQIYQALHISEGWFMRMIKSDFHEPNPFWMQRINAYLDGLEVLKKNVNEFS